MTAFLALSVIAPAQADGTSSQVTRRDSDDVENATRASRKKAELVRENASVKAENAPEGGARFVLHFYRDLSGQKDKGPA